jgi:hypothetical protein
VSRFVKRIDERIDENRSLHDTVRAGSVMLSGRIKYLTAVGLDGSTFLTIAFFRKPT